MRTWDRLLIAAFAILLMVPGVGLVAGIGQSSGQDENRELAAPPVVAFDWTSIRALPDGFSRYFEDHFAFRGALVRAQAAVRLLALGSTPSTDVIAGRDGWLFYAADGAIEDFIVDSPLSASDLETWRRTLQHVQGWLAAQGIRFVFVIVPDKHQVYPEMMPASVRPLRSEPRLDQLITYLRDRSTVNMVDLRPALLAAKAHERIYHRTDTHWNDRGALVAYQQIATAAGLVPLSRSDFIDHASWTRGMDLAATLALADRLREEDLSLEPKQPRRARVTEPLHPSLHGEEARLVTQIDDPTLPRAVIYRDSFTTGLMPFLSEHFSRAVYLWEYDVDPALIAAEHPDVVIMEVVGRRIGPFLPYDAIAALPHEADTAGALDESDRPAVSQRRQGRAGQQ